MVNSVPELDKSREFAKVSSHCVKMVAIQVCHAANAQAPTPLHESVSAGNRPCMGIFKNIFTWWDGATFGTWLGTATKGTRVGHDAEGNVYYEGGKTVGGLARRWVMYNGLNDASRVPPEWHGWLHHMIDDVPENALPPARIWQKPPSRNQTGTVHAYRPAGAPEAGGERAVATGDYQPWSPDQG